MYKQVVSSSFKKKNFKNYENSKLKEIYSDMKIKLVNIKTLKLTHSFSCILIRNTCIINRDKIKRVFENKEFMKENESVRYFVQSNRKKMKMGRC